MTSRARPRPSAIRRLAGAAESLCRLLEHTPDITRIPIELVDRHVDAVRAITREHARPDLADVAGALTRAAARGHRRFPQAGKRASGLIIWKPFSRRRSLPGATGKLSEAYAATE